MPAPRATPTFDARLLRRALAGSVAGLSPRATMRNPVLFVTWLGALLVSVDVVALTLRTGAGDVSAVAAGAGGAGGDGALAFGVSVAVTLWLTVWFASLAEALAEVRGRAQADSLRACRRDVVAHRLAEPRRDAPHEDVPGSRLIKGDHVLVAAGEVVPADGEVVVGVASVDESAVTGESAPVIRESGGDRSAVTGGTVVLSDWLVVRVTAGPGETFLDRMIAMVEGAARQKTPNEIALGIVLAGFTLAFLIVCVTLAPLGAWHGARLELATLVALLVCLIPTTIGGLLAAIGIAGMTRLGRRNVLAASGRAVEAAGDVDVLLLDKTGTITLGNRRATRFVPAPGVDARALAEAAQLASLPDETPEGRSIVVLAKRGHGLRGRALDARAARFVPFSAESRMSGLDLAERRIRKGACDAVTRWLAGLGGGVDPEVTAAADAVAAAGGTPLVVAESRPGRARALGVIQLEDVIKGGVRERFAELRRAGIKTIMITGDNPRTAAAIGAEAGVDDILAEATPEAKLALIRRYQEAGHLVAMTGDGTNDAPALAQADVAVAMQSGTQAAKEAGNMIDLDSDPTKLLDIVQVGKELLMTRGALTTFSIANDVAKYFAIVPAIFAGSVPGLDALDVMGLRSPRSAILSAVIFNALVIPALVPLALRGVRYRPVTADRLLARNLLVFGLGGLVAPFVGIKAIDLIVGSWLSS